MTSQSALGYQHMFSTVFQYLEEAYDISIHWQHIHGEGICGITMDQDKGQMAGEHKALVMPCESLANALQGLVNISHIATLRTSETGSGTSAGVYGYAKSILREELVSRPIHC